MTDRTCSVGPCEREAKTSGYCRAHYVRLKRTGSTGDAPVRDYQRGATCTAPGCDQPRHGLGYCNRHYKRLVEFGDISRGKTMPAGEAHWNWRGEDVEYSAAHSRVYRSRGPASAHQCSRCGESAEQWAYDGTDPDERTSTVGKAANCHYSTDPARYVPLCIPCHIEVDRGEATEAS